MAEAVPVRTSRMDMADAHLRQNIPFEEALV
jgi:hypothetical protein